MSEIQTATEYKIGKITFIVCASASEKASGTLEEKIKKLIRKDLAKILEK